MAGTLAGKRILVIEDEYFIASALGRALRTAEAVVVGPAADVSSGLSLLDGEAVDAAVLEVDLEGTTSYAIAERLAERAVPYMFLTGYDPGSLPETYRDVPRLPKPFPMRMFLAEVGHLVARGGRP